MPLSSAQLCKCQFRKGAPTVRLSIVSVTLAFLTMASQAENVSACHGSTFTCLPCVCGPISFYATVVVRLPADAKSFFDDHPTSSSGPTRLFTTSLMYGGGESTYTVRAETTRGG